MDITYGQLLRAVQVLRGTPQEPGLTNRKGLDTLKGFMPLRTILREAQGPLSDFDEGRKRLQEEFGDETTEDNEEFLEQWIALLDTEVSLDAKPVQVRAFSKMDPQPSFNELEALGPILAD